MTAITMSWAVALLGMIRDRLKIRIRDRRELVLYVFGTTSICVLAALAGDVANQLYFFADWPTAIRSWCVTVAIVVVIATPVSHAIGKAHLALYNASRTDSLTGLLNRRALLDQAQVGPTFMALVIIDVDRFKQVNDMYGHLAGDEVLRVTARVMRTMLADVGSIGRVGGEEFAILGTNADPVTFRARVEAFRAHLAATPIIMASTAVSVTLSGGMASRQENESFDQLYARADRALYLAKAAGRNRIVSADQIELEPCAAPEAQRARESRAG